MKHDAALNAKNPGDPNGGTWRDFWLKNARSKKPASRAKAEKALLGPEYPDSVGYLESIARRLHGRSGASMNGLAPVSEQTIDGYCQREGIALSSLEIDAVILLDAVMLHPEAFRSDDEDDEERPKPMAKPPELPKGGRGRA